MCHMHFATCTCMYHSHTYTCIQCSQFILRTCTCSTHSGGLHAYIYFIFLFFKNFFYRPAVHKGVMCSTVQHSRDGSGYKVN